MRLSGNSTLVLRIAVGYTAYVTAFLRFTQPDTYQLCAIPSVTVNIATSQPYCFLPAREFIYVVTDYTVLLARYLSALILHPSGICCHFRVTVFEVDTAVNANTVLCEVMSRWYRG